MNEEYRKKEQEFMATEALCDDVPPAQCDCSKCPLWGFASGIMRMSRPVRRDNHAKTQKAP